MKTDNGLAIAFFAVVMGGAVALAIAGDIAAPICKAAAASAPKDKFDFGCVEFWINRYQALLAAFLAAGVAVYVVRPVFRQLAEMRRQSAALLMERAEGQARETERERQNILSLRSIRRQCSYLDSLFNHHDWNWAHERWGDKVAEVGKHIQGMLDTMRTEVARLPAGDHDKDCRSSVVLALMTVDTKIWALDTAFLSQRSVIDPEAEFSSEEISAAYDEFDDATKRLRDATDDYSDVVEGAIQSAWSAWQDARDLAFKK